MSAKLDNDGYPTVCHHCGQKIVKTRQDSQHHHDPATRTNRSWHIACTPRALARAKKEAT